MPTHQTQASASSGIRPFPLRSHAMTAPTETSGAIPAGETTLEAGSASDPVVKTPGQIAFFAIFPEFKQRDWDRLVPVVRGEWEARAYRLSAALAAPAPAVPENVRRLSEAADALRGISEDFMTSERHHPGHVLIPSAKFEQLRAAEALLASDPPSGRAGEESERLREEVGYWRRDLSARLWFATGLYEAALRDGRLDEATTHGQAIRSGLAAFKAVDAGEFHSRCEVCGEFILPGEAHAGNEDISGHARCLIEGAQGEPRGPDDTDADLRARVVAAEAALAQPWPEDEDAAPAPATQPATPAEGR